MSSLWEIGNLPAWLVVLPIIGGVVTFLLPAGRRANVGLVFAVLSAILALVAGVIIAGGESLRHALGGWSAPLGIGLELDGLAAVFILMTALVGVVVSVYARIYFCVLVADPQRASLFWPLWLLLLAGLNGMYLAEDLFNLYVVIEVVGIAAVALAVLSGKTPALIAGLRYLSAAIVGSMAYLMGVALIYGATGVLDIGMAAAAVENGPTLRVAFALILVGLMVKTAVFPLHFWLPPAHSSAEPPVSAILSALVLKGTFYIILRLWVELFGVSLTFAAGQLMGALGAIAVIWGSLQALRQQRLKLVIAHSTVAQIGYLLLFFPLITLPLGMAAEADWTLFAWTGMIYQVLSHAFAKAAFFLAVGVVVIAVGNDSKDSLLNMVGRLPMATFAIGLAGVSLIGLPPSGGFLAKWMLLKAVFASGQWWWIPFILVGSLLTAGYVFMLLRLAFAPVRKEQAMNPIPRGLQMCALVLAIAAIVIALPAEWIVGLLEGTSAFGDAVEMGAQGGEVLP
jgi:formate hydrogenlyase subunit 3/multisubunit Na+/H+ antiporter MnhD subunit